MDSRSIRCQLGRKLTAMILIIAVAMFGSSQAWTEEYYTAAVYEHTRQGDKLIKDAPAAVIKSNLEYYETAAKAAKERGADIILFPEYGLFPVLDPGDMGPLSESVPDPNEVSVIPCDEEEQFADRQVLYTLSCMAKMNGIVVVANMGGREKCTDDTDGDCPEDGDLHFNTNVAFDSEGKIIARYYKERLFYEFGMSLPRHTQNPIFNTEFGKFAMFIGFDSIYEKMALTSKLNDIDAILLSANLINMSPFFTSTQWFQAWAIGNDATLLASTVHVPGYSATGSGIFRGQENSVAHAFNPDGIAKLIVAEIPRRNGGISSASITAILKNETREWECDDNHIPEICSYSVLGFATDIQTEYRCKDEKVQNYTLVKLHSATDHLEVCNNDMCCELDYVANSMDESYYFGVFNGSHAAYFNRYFWWDENCFLARCDDVNDTKCAIFPMASHGTLFHSVSMKASFTTNYIYPSFVSNKMRLVPVENWTFTKRSDWSSITMNSVSGTPLIAATMKGRVYEKDPPYTR